MPNQHKLTIDDAYEHFRFCVEAYRQGAFKPGEHQPGSRRRGAVAVAGEKQGLASGSWNHRYDACVRLMGREPDWEGNADFDGSNPGSPRPAPLTFPDFPDEHPETGDLIDRLCTDFERRKRAVDAKKWFPIKVNIDGPIAVSFMGDPHVDDNGCNWPLLKRDCQILATTPGMFAVNIGDSENNWAGRLAHLYSQQDTSRATAKKLVEWLFRDSGVRWLALLLGNHDCLDPETEALTARGWLKYHDIQADDLILSINPATGDAEWSPILAKIERPNTERMVAIKAQAMDVMVTPNHRVLHRKRNSDHTWGDLAYGPAEKLPARFRLPVAGRSRASTVTLSDDQIALAGWLLTDGGISRPKQGNPCVSFYQSKESPELERLLASLDLAHVVDVRVRDIQSVCGRALVKPSKPQRVYRLGVAASAKILDYVPEKGAVPDWIMGCDDRQFSVFLDAVVAGDGSWYARGGEPKRCAVVHGAKPFLDSLQAAAVAHGWRAHLSVARGADWRLNLSREIEWEADRAKVVSSADPAPWVWCLTVPHTNFMVRRNGKAHFTGNCWGNNEEALTRIATGGAPISDWSAQFRLVFRNGRETKIWASHHFPGHSQWNPGHGAQKAAMFTGAADIYASGHHHNHYVFSTEDAARKQVYWTLRARGYKFIDDYATKLGHESQNSGATVTAVINPYATDDAEFIQCFASISAAARYLNFIRSEWANSVKEAA